MDLQVGQASQLRTQASDGSTGLFLQVVVYDSSGSPTATLSGAHVAGGLYSASWTPSTEGHYTAVSHLYADSGHTLDAGFDVVAEDLDVNSTRSALARILGLVQENVVIDQQGYDGDGNLTGARIRSYDSAAHATAAGATGLVATYTVLAGYSAGQLNLYRVTLVP